MNKFIAVGLLLFAFSCGTDLQAPEASSANVSEAALEDDNGLSVNGFSTNGFSTNGFSTNGFSTNGFSTNGWSVKLATGTSLPATGRNASFDAWFNSNVATNSSFMKYMIKCAQAAGEVVTYTSTAGVTYTWNGALGVAPNWRLGNQSLADQQAMTACLMSHVNVAATTVPMSMRSPTVASSAAERAKYVNLEGAYFGNIFGANKAVFSCKGDVKNITMKCPAYTLPTTVTSDQYYEYLGRACEWGSNMCGFTDVGRCSAVCTWDAASSSYSSCTVGGVTYVPMTPYRPNPTGAAFCAAFG